MKATEERMKLKRTILKRGCLMVKSLYEMSQNETSYETLLKWHQRIENISYPIHEDGKKCYPPFLANNLNLVLYQIHTENARWAKTNSAKIAVVENSAKNFEIRFEDSRKSHRQQDRTWTIRSERTLISTLVKIITNISYFKRIILFATKRRMYILSACFGIATNERISSNRLQPTTMLWSGQNR